MSGATAYKELVGQEVIAAELGVTSQAISNWFKRALTAPASSHLRKMPEPTYVQYRPGKEPGKVWRRQQLGPWRKWYKVHLAEQGGRIPEKRASKPARRLAGTGWV